MTIIAGSANLAIALCKALGLDPAMTTRIDLSITSDKLPQLAVTRYVPAEATDRFKRMSFEIVSVGPAEEEPLDLDAMCDDAMDRLRHGIDELAFYAHEQTRRAFKETRRLCWESWCYMDQQDWAYGRYNPYRDEFKSMGASSGGGGWSGSSNRAQGGNAAYIATVGGGYAGSSLPDTGSWASSGRASSKPTS